MKIKSIAPILVTTFILSACTKGMMGGGSTQGMDHSQMMSSSSMSNTMSMSGTMSMNATMAVDHAAMMDKMTAMMATMQGMMDGSSPGDSAAMHSMMGDMESMMATMNDMHSAMMTGSMPIENQDNMQGMMGKMTAMMDMMNQMHAKMKAGSLPMSEADMGRMTEHMSQMGGMMQMMQSMMGGSMTGMDHGSMQMDPSKPLDAQFIDSMVIHHLGAVDMANEVLQKAEHDELKTFAEAIIAAQTEEISDMQSWRKAWYPDLADTGGMDMGMGDMSVSSDESKPYDQRFLEAMISHHQGAIDMAQMALQMGSEHEEIKTLSEAIIKAQQAEIEQMKAWLKAWYNQ